MIEEILCPHCRANVVLDSSQRGQDANCPWCAQSFRVPATPGEQPPAEAPAVPAIPPAQSMPESTFSFDDIPSVPPVEPMAPTPEAPAQTPGTDLTPEPAVEAVVEEPVPEDLFAEAAPTETTAPPILPPVEPEPKIDLLVEETQTGDGELAGTRGEFFASEPAEEPSAETPPATLEDKASESQGYDLAQEEPVVADEVETPSGPPPTPMSRLTLPCPHCAGQVIVTPELRGRWVNCPHCRRAFVMPGGFEESARPLHMIGRHRGSEVPDYLLPAVLATIFCCLPIGIPAILFAADANAKKQRGELSAARASADKAVKFMWTAVVSGLVVIFFWLLRTGR